MFNMYGNADQQDVEAIRNFFSVKTTCGEQVINAIVSTFRTLCAEASFEPEVIQVSEETKPLVKTPSTSVTRVVDTQSLTINIQVTLYRLRPITGGNSI